MAQLQTKARQSIVGRPSSYLEEALYTRLFRNGGKERNVRAELNQFLKSRKRVYKWEVGLSVRKLRERKLFGPALKLSEIMAKRGMNPTTSDKAIYLDLVAKTRGIEAAEKYFVELPDHAKNNLTYGALLNCYCKELMTDKAEALMEKMKLLHFASSSMAYNSLMTLYTKSGNPEKVLPLIQEMKISGILPDSYTYNVWMRALAAANDIGGVEGVIEEMKKDEHLTADWTTYSNLASIYVNAGMMEKAEIALKKLETKNTEGDIGAFQFLITLYGQARNLVEVYRVWRSLKHTHSKMANISYLNMLQVLVNLNDLPGAEKCFSEWESSCETYDVRIANVLIGAYAGTDMIEKADKLRRRAKGKGAKLNAKTWEIFMDYYLRKGKFKEAVQHMANAVEVSRGDARKWMPTREVIQEVISHSEKKQDVDLAENLIEILDKSGCEKGQKIFESLIRIYIAAGRKSPLMRRRLKMEKVEVGQEVEELLNVLCAE